MPVIVNEMGITDLNSYIPEYINCKDCNVEMEKHINQEGARYHVLSWDTKGSHCSESSCEIHHKDNHKSFS